MRKSCRAAPALLHSCILAFAWVTPAAAEVADYLGKPVASVRLVLDGRETTERALVQVVETRAGNPLSMLEVRESITHLFSLGAVRRCARRCEPRGCWRGAAVRAQPPFRVVSKIEFAGNVQAPGIEVGELRRALVGRFGTSPPPGRADQLSIVISDTLRERGVPASGGQPAGRGRSRVGARSARVQHQSRAAHDPRHDHHRRHADDAAGAVSQAARRRGRRAA